MKIENTIKKCVEQIKSTNNENIKKCYREILNACKKELIEIICDNNDFFKMYYEPNEKIYNIYNFEYLKAFYKLYNIKNIECRLDKNFCTQVIDIEFNI